ncbi:MAG: DnaB-like helicase C-terminal domain-containing protein [Candidatus Margulisbacteria bacterium]|nr:DnaB-like helicase C-terminal domain-containing protein [Candidatus Margulisiibacteriota bacterium]
MKVQEILEDEKVKTKTEVLLSGLKDYDDAVDGIAPGEMMIVSAPPAVGKTAFCTAFALSCAMKNIKVLYLTSSPAGCIAKRLAGLNINGPLYIEHIEGVAIEGVKMPGIEDEAPGEMEQIIEQYAIRQPAEELKGLDPVEMYTRKLPPWLLIIDSIDYVYKYYPKQGNYEEVRCELLKKYIKGIKRLAKKFNAAVIITANALDSGDVVELPREVAACAPLAEVICLLDINRDEEDQRNVVVEILKNVRRGSGVLTLGIDRKTWMLKDYA